MFLLRGIFWFWCAFFLVFFFSNILFELFSGSFVWVGRFGWLFSFHWCFWLVPLVPCWCPCDFCVLRISASMNSFFWTGAGVWRWGMGGWKMAWGPKAFYISEIGDLIGWVFAGECTSLAFSDHLWEWTPFLRPNT